MGRDQAAVRELRREHVSLARKKKRGSRKKEKKKEEGGRGIVNKEAKDPKVITSGRGEIEREENVGDIDVHLKGYVPLAIGHIMHQRLFAVGKPLMRGLPRCGPGVGGRLVGCPCRHAGCAAHR